MLRLLSLWFLLLLIAPAHAQSDTLEDDLQDLLDSFRDPGSPAVVLTVWTPDGMFSAASGRVALDTADPATPDSRFRIGSVSKTYTAVAVLDLVEQGLIALDDPIGLYLPADVIDPIDGTDDVTVRQLLTMTSGLPEYLLDDFFDAALDDPTYAWTPLEALTFAHDFPASFDPGEDFEYTNTNYLLLQLIVEAVTGEPFHVVVRETILEPVGAAETYTQIMEDLPGGFVHGYEDLDEDGTLDDLTEVNDGAGMGDGALIATAPDVARFYAALFYTQDLLSPDTLAMMLEDPENYEYGMGVEVYDDPDYGMIYGHSGSVLGFTSDARYFAADDVIVVLLHADVELDPDWVYIAFEWAADF
jgi:D-alanyl-D-alanine carboxypeptidase